MKHAMRKGWRGKKVRLIKGRGYNNGNINIIPVCVRIKCSFSTFRITEPSNNTFREA